MALHQRGDRWEIFGQDIMLYVSDVYTSLDSVPQEYNSRGGPRWVIYILEELSETDKPKIQGHLGWGSERRLHLIVIGCRRELDGFCPSMVSPALASYGS